MARAISRHVSYWAILLVCFLLEAPLAVSGNHPDAWNTPHFSLGPKALYDAASLPRVPASTDISVLEDEQTYAFDAQGRVTCTAYLIYKVLAQKGVEGADSVSMEWEPWHQERPAIRVRVITPDYAVHELDAKTLSEAPAREDEARVYSDRKVLRAPLPAVAPGSVVEREIITVSTPYFADAGFVGYGVLGRVGTPLQQFRLTIDAPASFPLHYVLQDAPDIKPEHTEQSGRVKLTFTTGPTAALEEAEAYLPNGVVGYPAVMFAAGTSWPRVAEGYAQILEATLRNVQVNTLVEGLVRGEKSRAEKEAAILAFLSKEVRYTGIEFGENSIIPHSTSQSLVRRYGDCKDKALLLVAMLRAARIPAYMALLNPGRGIGVLPELPGLGMFSHAIVYVPGEPDLWVDPSDEYSRFGQLPFPDQGQWALIVRSGGQGLVRIPEDPSMANWLHELPEMHLAESGPAQVLETTEPHGAFESGFRETYVDRQDKNVQENLTNYVKEQYFAAKLDRWERSDPHDFSRPFKLELECSKARRGWTDLDSAEAAIRLDHLFNWLPDDLQRREAPPEESVKPAKKRTADYQLAMPFVKEWEYKIIPPTGFQPGPLPKDVKLALGPATLTEKFSADGDGVVHADIRFDSVKRRYTVAEATDLRNKVAEIENGEAILINFEPLARILQKQGKMRESFQAYHQLIDHHPKEAIHHLQLAKALLEGGMGEAARNEARLAARLDPNSALAEKILAVILEYDLVGRIFRPESDLAGAAEAFRAAEKLDPDDKYIVTNLAILLEYNADGLRRGPGSRLPEAVAEYHKLTEEELTRMGMQNNLALDLFYEGKFAEARDYALTLNPQPKTLLIACAAALDGGEAAVNDAGKLMSDESSRKQTLEAAGLMLLNLRRYSLGADLLQAGAAGDYAFRRMAQAEGYRKTRRHEDVTLPNDPQGLAKRFFLLSMDPDATRDELYALFSRNALTVWKNSDPEEIDRLVKNGLRLRRKWARRDWFWDCDLDFRLQGTEIKSAGSDALGYREKLQVPSGVGEITVFVVKENGEYKILEANGNPAVIGLEILDRLAAHDLNGARTLLDWLREEQHLSGGDDPFDGLAFPRFWTKGKNPDPRVMKLAAAAILVQAQATARQGVKILEEARESSASDEERTKINAALLNGYDQLDDFEKLLAVGLEMTKNYPESGSVFSSTCKALGALGRFKEAQELAEQRLKRIPDDDAAELALMRNAVAEEDYSTAYDWGKKVLEQGKGGTNQLNTVAWKSLFFARPGGPDVETALKAAESRTSDSYLLHTLGCLYAEVGKTKEAYDVLIRAMDLRDMDEPDPDFWYAFGRIAEQYGERQIALADYAKVTKPKRDIDIPDSCYRLAQNRLKVLQSEPTPPSRRAAK